MPGREPVTANSDPVPVGYRFDVVWRGYNRRQVNEFLNMELRWLSADRDAAVAMVCRLTSLLNDSRAEARRLRERFDEQCREPLPAGALTERLRRLEEIAHADASAIVARARARAEHIQTKAAEAALRHEVQAERRRRLVEEDFHSTMAKRRAEVLRSLREHEACRRAEADRLVRDARQHAEHRLASAAAQVKTLHGMRVQLAHRLNLVRGLFLQTSALLDGHGEPVTLDPERRPG